uniref:Uncharacterized protein n=1 Tax=Romanomermis culicivorax TaxID=13658 RepID=A0A915KPC7_ROMCU
MGSWPPPYDEWCVSRMIWWETWKVLVMGLVAVMALRRGNVSYLLHTNLICSVFLKCFHIMKMETRSKAFMLLQITSINSPTNQSLPTKSLTRFHQRIKNGSNASGKPKNQIPEISSTNWKISLTNLLC